MSIIFCEKCQTHVDTDFDEDHEDECCATCDNTGEVSVLAEVWPGEPNIADIGTQPCPDCQLDLVEA